MAENKLIAGRFEQLELIGTGGMGAVYRGRNQQTGEDVAIKELKSDILKQDPEITQRFAREGEALRKLNHPSIVKVLASVQDGNEHYIVLEYVKGGSLREKLDETPQLPLREILELALDLSDALARAHRLNIIHRDIKPANVLIADDGTPRLTDFGVAHIGDSSQITKTGVVMGTMSYLPPEALAGEKIDHRADIWAFGVMLYEMLAGRRPFDGDNSGAIVAAILQKEPPDLFKMRSFTEEPMLGFFVGLIYWMLEKDRTKRPDSFRLIGALIEDLLAGKETKFNWQLAKPDAENTISPSEAAAMMRDMDSNAYKLDNTPTTPAALNIISESDSRSDWAIKTKRQMKHAPRIFLSYRREDSIAITGRLYDRLSAAFGEDYVFKDMEDIPVGSDFKKVIDDSIRSSDVVLVIIGRKWLNVANEEGRRLEDPHDFVRLEVQAALNNAQSLVIPVLVDNADMPEARLLPDPMKNLIYRNAAPVRNDPDFNRDVEWLIKQIRNSFEIEKPRTSGKPLLVAITVLAILALAIGIGFAMLNITSTPSFTIEPVPAGDYMVLVAEPEFIVGTERNVQDNILRDLEQNLSDTPVSRIHIRSYPAVIRNAEDALRIAEQYDAHIIIWGNYDDERIEMNIQIGDLSLVPNLQFSREELERFANATYEMTDEREQTLAFGVVAALNAIHTMANDPVELGRNVLVFEQIVTSSATIQGNGVNVYYHRYVTLYTHQDEEALQLLTTAIEDVDPHAFLYLARSLVYQSLNRIDEAEADIRTSRQLVTNPNWIMPEISLVNAAVYFEADYAKALEIFPNNFSEAAAGSWIFPAYRGILRYFTGDFEGARTDTELSLSLNPSLSLPYTIATALAFRDGDILAARRVFDEVKDRFYDPRVTERFLTATYNPIVGDSAAVRFFSAFASIIPGRWTEIIEDTQAIIDMGLPSADIYLIKGFAHCNLEQFEEAEEAYTLGIELDPDFVMLYGLRAEARYRQGFSHLLDSQADIDFVLRSGQTQFAALSAPLLSGDYGCEDFLTFDFASLLEATQEANE